MLKQMKRPFVLIDKAAIATSVGCFLALGGLLNEAVLFIVDLLAAANLWPMKPQQPPPKETTAL